MLHARNINEFFFLGRVPLVLYLKRTIKLNLKLSSMRKQHGIEEIKRGNWKDLVLIWVFSKAVPDF